MSTAGNREKFARAKLEDLRASLTLREMASRMGISHVTLIRFLDGQEPRRATLARIEAFLSEPHESDVFRRWKDDLRRLLGRFPAKERKNAERAIGQVLLNQWEKGRYGDAPAWMMFLAGR